MSQFVEVNTAELIGAALDWAVAKAAGLTEEKNGLSFDRAGRPTVAGDFAIPYQPSTNWAQVGPLIEQFGLDLWKHEGKFYAFHTRQHNKYCADTVLVASCRAIVATKLGDVVQVPAELAGEAK